MGPRPCGLGGSRRPAVGRAARLCCGPLLLVASRADALSRSSQSPAAQGSPSVGFPGGLPELPSLLPANAPSYPQVPELPALAAGPPELLALGGDAGQLAALPTLPASSAASSLPPLSAGLLAPGDASLLPFLVGNSSVPILAADSQHGPLGVAGDPASALDKIVAQAPTSDADFSEELAKAAKQPGLMLPAGDASLLPFLKGNLSAPIIAGDAKSMSFTLPPPPQIALVAHSGLAPSPAGSASAEPEAPSKAAVAKDEAGALKEQAASAPVSPAASPAASEAASPAASEPSTEVETATATAEVASTEEAPVATTEDAADASRKADGTERSQIFKGENAVANVTVDETMKVEPAPKAGLLITRVQHKLGVTHDRLEVMMQQIMEVGKQIQDTEQAMLGKVLDVGGAKGLVAERMAIEAANDRSELEVKHLHEQIDALNVLLAQAQATYIAEQQKQRQAETELMAQLQAHNKLMSGLQTTHGKLLLSRNRLETQLAHDKLVEKNVSASLSSQQTMESQTAQAESVLRRHLIEIHDYNKKCNARALETHARVVELSKLKPITRSAAAVAAERQAEQTQIANNQRLRAEMAVLQAEVERVEGSSAAGLAALKQHVKETNELEQSIIKDVRWMGTVMYNTKEKMGMLQESIQANIEATTELTGKKKVQEEELSKWREKVNPVVFAAAEAENMQLQLELNQALDRLREAKTEEAAAYAWAQQLLADEDSQRGAVAAAVKARDAALEEGKLQVQAALSVSAQHKENMQAVLSKAQKIVAAKCQATWDDRKAEKDEEKKACDQLKQELVVVQAQKASLEQSLQAAETASAVEEEAA